MRLIETTTLTAANLPMEEFKAQLRLGTGFTDSGTQDVLLEACLKAAMGAIEARTGRILVRRRFLWRLNTWRLDGNAQNLPVTPVTAMLYLRMMAPDGSYDTVDPASYTLQPDDQRPRIVSIGKSFPPIETGGSAEMFFIAGYAAWKNIPSALSQAMLMLAASYYENREGMISGAAQMPFGISAMLEPFKRIRLGAAP